MKRGNFILRVLTFFPLSVFPKKTNSFITRQIQGFKVNSCEARYGIHYKMKGITLNVLDIKISSKDTDGALAVFEQNGFTPEGGPP